MAKIIPAEEKVFMVSNSTNTTYSGSAALKAMQQWYTMEDVTNTVKPYKVFTALLTQNGISNNLAIANEPLTIGVTYIILDDGDGGGCDFTNVGAPNNNFNTYFVATGTTPNSWGENVYLEYNTGAPVATVLENTIGNVWFTYSVAGQYYLNSFGIFLVNKYFNPQPLSGNDPDVWGGGGGSAYWTYRFSDNTVMVTALADSQLNNSPIEIRVYN